MTISWTHCFHPLDDQLHQKLGWILQFYTPWSEETQNRKSMGYNQYPASWFWQERQGQAMTEWPKRKGQVSPRHKTSPPPASTDPAHQCLHKALTLWHSDLNQWCVKLGGMEGKGWVDGWRDGWMGGWGMSAGETIAAGSWDFNIKLKGNIYSMKTKTCGGTWCCIETEVWTTEPYGTKIRLYVWSVHGLVGIVSYSIPTNC